MTNLRSRDRSTAIRTKELAMKIRPLLTFALAAAAMVAFAQVASAQTGCGCQPAVSYVAPAAAVSVVPTTTYYAPAPTVTYYAPAPAVTVVPTTTYYAPAPVYYPAPVTVYRPGLFGWRARRAAYWGWAVPY